MGLDITLYTAEQAAKNAEYDRACNEWYGDDNAENGETPYGRATEDERRAWSSTHNYTSADDVPSSAHPEHLFNRRYLRSSYNSGGFNHAVPDMIGSAGEAAYPDARGSLYWIFSPMGREWDGDAGDLAADDLPRLAECRERALSVVDALKSCDRLRVAEVGANIFSGPSSTTDDEALRLYRDQVAQGTVKPDEWWSNRDMDVFGDGLAVLAAVPGRGTLGNQVVHLIYRAGDDGFDSYVQSAEIVVEFIDEATELIRRDGGARISWSG